MRRVFHDFPKHGSTAFKALNLCGAEPRTSREIYQILLRREPDTLITQTAIEKALSRHQSKGYVTSKRTGERRDVAWTLTPEGELALDKATRHAEGDNQQAVRSVYDVIKEHGEVGIPELAKVLRDRTPNAIRHSLKKLVDEGKVRRRRDKESLDLRRHYYSIIEEPNETR